MSDLVGLAKLRNFEPGMDLEKFMTTEFRQNMRALEETIKNSPSSSSVSSAVSSAISAVSATIVGEIKIWPGPTVPSGYLLCDGASCDISSYPALAAILLDASTGLYAWGGSGAQFNLPDLRGVVPRGVAGTSTKDPDKASRTAILSGGNTGNAVGSYQGDQLNSHTHTIGVYNTGGGAVVSQGSGGLVASSQVTGATGGNETRMRNVYVNYIIKY